MIILILHLAHLQAYKTHKLKLSFVSLARLTTNWKPSVPSEDRYCPAIEVVCQNYQLIGHNFGYLNDHQLQVRIWL